MILSILSRTNREARSSDSGGARTLDDVYHTACASPSPATSVRAGAVPASQAAVARSNGLAHVKFLHGSAAAVRR